MGGQLTDALGEVLGGFVQGVMESTGQLVENGGGSGSAEYVYVIEDSKESRKKERKLKRKLWEKAKKT